MPTLGEPGNFPVVAPGIYDAEVLEVKEQDSKFYSKDDGTPQRDVVWKFAITDGGEFDGQFVWGRTTPTFTTSPECRLRRWAETVLNQGELPLGYDLKQNDEGIYPDLAGRAVRIFVKQTTTGKAKVDELLVSMTGASTSPAPAAVGAQTAITDFGEEPF